MQLQLIVMQHESPRGAAACDFGLKSLCNVVALSRREAPQHVMFNRFKYSRLLFESPRGATAKE